MIENTENKIRIAVEEIVAAEYEYIAQTAFQAQEDRARVSTFYLVSVGSLFVAFFSTINPSDELIDPSIAWVFFGSFVFLSFFGFLTLLQLIRLRQAWFSSVTAMNQIKDFAIEHAQGISLEKAFLWRANALPKTYKPWSVGFLLALQVILLGAVILGAAIFYAGLATNTPLTFWAFIVGFLYATFQIFIYWVALKEKKAE